MSEKITKKENAFKIVDQWKNTSQIAHEAKICCLWCIHVDIQS